MMRKLVWLLLFFFSSFELPAQNIYPNGAKWYYSQPSFLSPDTSFSTLEVIADTVINTIQCKKLNKLSGCDFLPATVYIYSDSNKVYFYNSYLQSFKLLYDFAATQGGSWIVYPESPTFDSLIVTVDSTSSEVINNDTLKVIYTAPVFSSPNCFGFGGKIIEKIGDVGYFFPQYCICDPNSGPLRCYSDSVLGLYETGIADSCDQIILGVTHISFENSISVFPNPVNNNLYLKLPKHFKNKQSVFVFYDSLGRIVYKEDIFFSLNPFSLDVKVLSSGFYHCNLSVNNKLYHFNFLKSNSNEK